MGLAVTLYEQLVEHQAADDLHKLIEQVEHQSFVYLAGKIWDALGSVRTWQQVGSDAVCSMYDVKSAVRAVLNRYNITDVDIRGLGK